MGICTSKSRRFSFRKMSRRSGKAYTAGQDEEQDFKKPSSIPFQLSDVVTCLDSTDGQLCFAGSNDGSILVQDLTNNKIILQTAAHEKEVTKIKCCGEYFISASRDKTIKIWKLGNSQEEAKLSKHTLAVTAIDCNDDFTLVYSGSRDNSVVIWDTNTQTCIEECKVSRNLVTDLCMSSEMGLLVQTSEDRILKLWDPRTLQIIHSFPPQSQIQTSCALMQNYCMTTNNGFGNEGCEVCWWDLRKQELVQILRGHSETVTCCKFIDHNYRFATCSHDGTVKLWQPSEVESNATLQSTLYMNSGPLSCLSSLNEKSLLCGSIENGISMINVKESELTF